MSNIRVDLSKVIPLTTPFSLHVFPSYYCNFRCFYCLHNLSSEKLIERNFKREFINLADYKKAIDGLKEFPEKLKTIIFAGHGEPLVHRDIAEMVHYANEAGVTQRTEIVTNGSLLSQKMTDRLIAAGLGLLRVSLQGVTDEMCRKVGGTTFPVARLVENLKYFYDNRKETRIHIKIINVGLNDNAEKERFYELFSPICDEATIECLIPFINEIDHSAITNDLTKCKLGHSQSMSKICSMPFYMLVLEPNGNLVPCCSSVVPKVYGNIRQNRPKELWNSVNRSDFLYQQLTDLTKNRVCAACSVPQYGLQEGDYLDGDRDVLLEKFHRPSKTSEGP